MSTNFNPHITAKKRVYSEHLQPYPVAINRLESGAAFYREATNSAEVYEVDFRSTALSGRGHALLRDGQVIVFKASSDNQEDAKLQLSLDGATVTYPLLGRGRPLLPGSISQNEIVFVFFNSEGLGCFEVLGLYSQLEVQFLDLAFSPGSLFFFNANGELAVLPPGTNGDLLTIDGGEPVWEAP